MSNPVPRPACYGSPLQETANLRAHAIQSVIATMPRTRAVPPWSGECYLEVYRHIRSLQNAGRR